MSVSLVRSLKQQDQQGMLSIGSGLVLGYSAVYIWKSQRLKHLFVTNILCLLHLLLIKDVVIFKLNILELLPKIYSIGL